MGGFNQDLSLSLDPLLICKKTDKADQTTWEYQDAEQHSAISLVTGVKKVKSLGKGDPGRTASTNVSNRNQLFHDTEES